MMAPMSLQHRAHPLALESEKESRPVVEESPTCVKGFGLCRTRTLFSLGGDASTVSSGSTLWSTSCSSSISSASSSALEEPQTTKWFGVDVREVTNGRPSAPEFHTKELRNVIEPHIAKARLRRDQSRQRSHVKVDASIASSVGVPYTSLRSERRYLYDVDTYPLHQVLVETLGVEDLSLIHEHQIQDKRFLMAALLQRQRRRRFHECYDNFVTSFCIPLLHSMAMTKGIFQSTSSKKIRYRYQAFPCIRVVRPGEFSTGPHCDVANGHTIGNLNFHIPLTAAFGTNALYTESHPGREDWHPLTTKAVGLGYLFDGARCIHFATENTTDRTRVSLDFRIAIYIEDHINGFVDSELCTRESLEDHYSLAGPGYYEEATVDIGGGQKAFPGPTVSKLYRHHLFDPDKRVGFPFDK